MPSTSFAGGAIRVTTPMSFDASRAVETQDRGLPGEPGHATAVSKDALLAVLRDDDLVVVDRVDLTPRRGRGLDAAPTSNRRGRARFEVDVPPGEDAVVLLERDGMYSWHLPVNPIERTRSLDPGPRTAQFEIDVQPAKPLRRSRGGKPHTRTRGRRDRGLLGDIVQGAAQAIVFRFVAPAVLGKAVDALEQNTRTGLVHVTGAAIEEWTPIENLAALALPADRPARILLLVHGSFSSTVGGFGALALSVAGQAFLENALHSYDAVIGYDHKTLSLDPRANATDLLARLSTNRSSVPLRLDIITHSRGGLTTRSFVEQVLPQSDSVATVDKIVFVAATNSGTHRADPSRWGDLIDLYTNLGSVVARALSLLPGAAPVVTVVGGVMRGIAAFVKYLVSYAAEGHEVPGLAAMIPGGDFVRELNGEQPGQPAPGTSWFVVSSNFHVSLLDDSHQPPEFPRELVVRLAEGFVDQIFEGDNDLVVDTASMAAIGTARGGFVADTLEFGTNDSVYHVNYFGQDRFVDRISGWLQQGMAAEAEPGHLEPEAVPSLPERGIDLRLPETGDFTPGGIVIGGGGPGESGFGGVGGGDRGLPDALPPPAPAPPPAAPPVGAPPPDAPAETTTAQLAAEMPGTLVVSALATVRVRLSRNTIRPTDGAAHVEENIEVVADRELSVQVIGTQNVEVIDRDPDVFELPAGGGTSELTFTVRALAPGPVVVTVVVRQGRVPIARMSLESPAVASAPATVFGGTPLASVAVHTGVDAPELDGLPCIDIVERALGNGKISYQYAVRIAPGEPARIFESRPMDDRDEKVRAALQRVEKTVRATRESPKEQLEALQDIGAHLCRQFFPMDMRAHLWEHRDEIADLILYADEPYVPWELVHLRPPTGNRQKTPRFLAQHGLVRWQLGSFPPKELRIRPGQARSICPVYADSSITNDEGLREQAFLAKRFAASPVSATPTAVRRMLRGGGFDLLHFSGHGAADPDDILGAAVLLKGRRRGTTIEQQYLSAVTVSENARSGEPGRPGPVVVINACQTGRAGESFTTLGGFAKAFLDAGASAFVSSLWSVHEQPARVFVEKLYDELLAGQPMSVASTAARAAARDAGDPTWLAYVVYARPDAVLATR